jgi:tetratricopeptide (TPR) repeat protein
MRGRVPPPPTLDVEPTLQLAIAKEGIGLELSAPVDLGAAKLVVARTRLLGLRFPLDVSGGVERFRHRRTALERAIIDVEATRAEKWLASLANDLVAPGPGDVRLATIDHDVDLDGLRERRGDVRVDLSSLGDEEDAGMLSFDVTLGASGSGLVAYAHRARGVGVESAASALVGRFFQRVAGALGGRARGLRLELDDPARIALVHSFVPRGARVPMRDQVVVCALSPTPDGWTTTLERDRPPKSPRAIFTALRELDRAVGEADAAHVEGDVEKARASYLRALEKTPRHKAILLRLAELDAANDDRAESALAWLREAHKTRGSTSRDQDDNELGRSLLFAATNARVQAFGRARAAWQKAGEAAFDDAEARLASRAWALAAATCDDYDPQLLSLLDRALAGDPSEPSARWRRARLRISAGDDDRALEDVQHLEAIARGRESRRRTLLRAASLWADAGRNERAVPAYERALRHTPDDRDAVAGLGEALIAAGEVGRGVALLARAVDLARRDGDDDGRSAVVLTLAEALADRVADPPAAIARLREIPVDSSRVVLARLLESSYRARLDDRVGATRAAAEALDLCEHRNVPPVDAPRVKSLLESSAASSRDDGDLPLARRLALAAVMIAPHDESVRALVRSLGASASVPAPAPPEPRHLDLDPETLLARFKANPDDDAVVDALIDVLSALGRDFELFALLSARFEEAPPDRRAAMKPKQRAVLERLAHAAEMNGRATEAALYLEAARALT